MPLMRRWSQALANLSRRFSSMPLRSARWRRARGVLAASSSRSVVRMPNDLRVMTSSASRPSMWLMGYDINVSSASSSVRHAASGELAEAGDRADDLADCVLPELFTCKSNRFAGHCLDLVQVEPGRHHARTDSHHTATKHRTRTVICTRRLHRGFGAGQLVDEALNLVGRPLFDQELQDDADGFLCGCPVDAHIGDETPEKLVHLPPTGPPLAAH